ncbi:MAG: type II secretion system F family protein [Planctomycetes bacterium]|nr:type II secretion system F family protein [Planctomycetota bacterium]
MSARPGDVHSLGAASRSTRERGSRASGAFPDHEVDQGLGEERLRLPLRERLALLGELQILLESGIQIPSALAGLRAECESPRAAAVLDRLIERVSSGAPLSAAAAACGPAFPLATVHLLRAGEASGRLDEMLGRLVVATEAEAALRSRLRSALTYPAVMAGVCCVVVAFLLTFIVPRFERLFAGKEAVLPAPTKILLGLSAFFSRHGLALLGVIAAAAVALVLWLRTPTGRAALDALCSRLPILGPITTRAALARSASTLGLMMQSGVPVLVALEHAAEVAGSARHQKLWNAVHREVASGGRLSTGLTAAGGVPSTVRQMIAAGEEAGFLDRVLVRIAVHLSSEVERRLKDLASLIEPAMVIFMGLVIGFVVLAILLPVFALSRGAAG